MRSIHAVCKPIKFGIGVSIVAALMLGGCGGGSSPTANGSGGSNPATTGATQTAIITGVAAVGYPISDGAVEIKCGDGSTYRTVTNNKGEWQQQYTFQATQPPCAVQVKGGTINNLPNATLYHSISYGSNTTVNVTPLTDLLVGYLANTTTPDTWFAGLSGAAISSPAFSVTSIDAAEEVLRTIYFNGLPPLQGINPISSYFVATAGDTYDDMLAALQITMTQQGVIYQELLGAVGNLSTSNSVIIVNNNLQAAYAGTLSGGIAPATTTAPASKPCAPGAICPSFDVILAPLTLSKTTLNFPPTGTVSAAQVVTLTNPNSYGLDLYIAINGNNGYMTLNGIDGVDGYFFKQTNNCVGNSQNIAYIGANSSCTIRVVYSPEVSGFSSTATLQIKARASLPYFGSTGAEVNLSGSSLMSACIITGPHIQTLVPVKECHYNFPALAQCGYPMGGSVVNPTYQRWGTASCPSDSTFTKDWGGLILKFRPSSSSSSQRIVNTSGPYGTILVFNNSSVPIPIGSIVTTADFTQTSTCGSSLANGASCSINVTFSPTALGARTGKLSVYSKVVDSVNLYGTAFPDTPVMTIGHGECYSGLYFYSQNVGTTGNEACGTILTNVGLLPVNISSITTTGAFGQSNNCGTILAAGAKCGIGLTFTPTVVGPSSGTLTIASDAVFNPLLYSPNVIRLTAYGIVSYSLSSSALTFAAQNIGTSSPTQAVTVTNISTLPISLGISVGGDFSHTTTCGSSLAGGASCLINTAFKPTVAGAVTGVLSVSGGGLRKEIILKGTGSGPCGTSQCPPPSTQIAVWTNLRYGAGITIDGVSVGNLSSTCNNPYCGSGCTLTTTVTVGDHVVGGSTSAYSNAALGTGYIAPQVVTAIAGQCTLVKLTGTVAQPTIPITSTIPPTPTIPASAPAVGVNGAAAGTMIGTGAGSNAANCLRFGQITESQTITNICSVVVNVMYCHTPTTLPGGWFDSTCGADGFYTQRTWLSPGEVKDNKFSLPLGTTIWYGACQGGSNPSLPSGKEVSLTGDYVCN